MCARNVCPAERGIFVACPDGTQEKPGGQQGDQDAADTTDSAAVRGGGRRVRAHLGRAGGAEGVCRIHRIVRQVVESRRPVFGPDAAPKVGDDRVGVVVGGAANADTPSHDAVAGHDHVKAII